MSSLSSAPRHSICQVMTTVLLLAAAVICVTAAARPASAQTFNVLHDFTDSPDGSRPFGGLVADRKGNYYGTTQFGGTSSNGTVFELSPPAAGGGDWTETVIWNFAGGTDGSEPSYQLVMDGKGNLYGETQIGGNASCGCGTVFVMVPPKTSGGSWSKRVLYAPALGGASGSQVLYGGLTLDSSGAVYGTQFGGGTTDQGLAFKIAPVPGGRFVETTIYNFGATSTDSIQPFGPVTIDSIGNLYGVSQFGGVNDGGTVYKLTPATGSGPWTNAVLYSFPGTSAGCNPQGNVILDRAGRLYGQTTSCGGSTNEGVIFRLTPPAGSGLWTESVLHTFGMDGGGQFPSLSFDPKRNVFYGTSFFGGGVGVAFGVVFQLAPPGAGGGPWTETVLHRFTNGTDGANPLGPMVWDSNGVLYGTGYVISTVGEGNAFSIVP